MDARTKVTVRVPGSGCGAWRAAEVAEGGWRLCEHEHAGLDDAMACAEANGWPGVVEAERLPLQGGDSLNYYNREPYATGGKTIDVSAYMGKVR